MHVFKCMSNISISLYQQQIFNLSFVTDNLLKISIYFLFHPRLLQYNTLILLSRGRRDLSGWYVVCITAAGFETKFSHIIDI